MECELCLGEESTTTVEYRDCTWNCCDACKVLAENE